MLIRLKKAVVLLLSIILIVSLLSIPTSAASTKTVKTKYHIMAIGSSNTYRYLIPHILYRKYSVTTQLVTEPGLQGKSIKYFIQQAKKDYNPELFMVDLRWFIKYAGEPKTSKAFLNKAFKAVNRLTDKKIRSNAAYELLNHAKSKKLTKSQLKKKYPKWFSTKGAVFLKENEMHGFRSSSNHKVLSKKDYSKINEQLALSKDTENTLRSLLNYLNNNKINTLFTLTPYQTNENAMKYSNEVQALVQEYGFTMLNTNKNYNKLKVNFKTDFYNSAHMNINGAVKYSLYIGKYLNKNYKFKTKLNNTQKKDWKNDVKGYFKVKKQAYKKLYPKYKKAKVLKYVNYKF